VKFQVVGKDINSLQGEALVVGVYQDQVLSPVAARIDEKMPNYAYPLDMGIKEKIEMLARTVYRAETVTCSPRAKKYIRRWEELGFGDLPLSVAKTQYSFSDNPKLLGAPENFEIHIREVKLSAGAGFIIPIAGEIMRMPGLPRHPAAEKIDIDDDGNIVGLF